MLKRIFLFLCIFSAVLPTAVFGATTPNDPDFSRQWYARSVGAADAWEYVTGGDVVVAVLDTGVDLSHPDLIDNIWINSKEIPGNMTDDDHNGYSDDVQGWNFVENNNDPRPQFSPGWTEAGLTHGTVIAGLIGAEGNNFSSIAGMSWKVKIMPLRILDSQGVGDSVAAARAIDYAIKNGARVLNFSFVTEEHNIALDEAIARAARAGVLVVAAAGNNKAQNGDNLDQTPLYPVCSDGGMENNVLGVAATDPSDRKADFSNYGANCVDISAPGVDMISTQVYHPSLSAFSSFTRSGWNGTSVASPLVSGAAALLLSANPGLSRKTLIEILTSSADPIDGFNPLYRGELGSGRLNLGRAMRMALGLPVAPSIQIATPLPANAVPYVVTGAGPGSAPEVRVHETNGTLVAKWNAYAPGFRGGVRVASGDLDGDGRAEVVTAAGTGGGPHIRVFDLKGNLLSQFFAYDQRFRGGVSVAVGDLEGDGKAEIITGAGPGGGPHVRTFGMDGKPKKEFFAYDKNVTTGVNVAAGDIDSDGKAEIAVGPASKAGSQPVKYYSSNLIYLGFITFLASSAQGGVSLAIADVVGDAHGDIILGRTIGNGAVTVIASGVLPRTPVTIASLKGISLGTLDLNADGHADLLVAPAGASGKARLVDAVKLASVTPFSEIAIPYSSGASVAGVLSAK